MKEQTLLLRIINRELHKTLASETAEAYYVVDEIRKLKRKDFNYSDIAILYRSNYLSREIEKVLMENHMPYIIYGGLRFYERMEVKDILSYLRLIVNGDDLAFQRVINQPKRGIGPKSIETILKIAQKENICRIKMKASGGLPSPSPPSCFSCSRKPLVDIAITTC